MARSFREGHIFVEGGKEPQLGAQTLTPLQAEVFLAGSAEGSQNRLMSKVKTEISGSIGDFRGLLC